MEPKGVWECIIIGGGPAGLTAALYLARYRRKVLLFDDLNSRALKIPLSHNYPGFPEGISGKSLLDKLHNQLIKYNILIINQRVTSLHLDKDQFVATTENDNFSAKTIILCTGVEDIEPPLRNSKKAIKNGLIRFCPVCDAYEVINKNIAVIGSSKAALDEAVFLRGYTQYITLITGKSINWTRTDLKKIHEAKIKIIMEDIIEINVLHNPIETTFSNKIRQFDNIYFALGCNHNNKLANDMHVKQKKGLIIVNNRQQTSIPGLYAAGDIVSGLNQICVATSQAAVAATSIHKFLPN